MIEGKHILILSVLLGRLTCCEGCAIFHALVASELYASCTLPGGLLPVSHRQNPA